MRPLVAITIALLLTGCMGAQWLTGLSNDYPTDWPTVTHPQNGCPDISGTFADIGVSSYRRPEYPHPPQPDESLAHRLFRMPVAQGRKVRISRPEADTYFVEVLEQDNLLISGKVSISSGDVACDATGVWFRPRVEKEADAMGGYLAERRIGLTKAVDGSLIGEERVFGVGALFWIVPVAGSQTEWFRWQPIK